MSNGGGAAGEPRVWLERRKFGGGRGAVNRGRRGRARTTGESAEVGRAGTAGAAGGPESAGGCVRDR